MTVLRDRLRSELATKVERHGVVTRAFAEVGVRVTVADAAANDRFLAALGRAADDLGVAPG